MKSKQDCGEWGHRAMKEYKRSRLPFFISSESISDVLVALTYFEFIRLMSVRKRPEHLHVDDLSVVNFYLHLEVGSRDYLRLVQDRLEGSECSVLCLDLAPYSHGSSMSWVFLFDRRPACEPTAKHFLNIMRSDLSSPALPRTRSR